MQPIIKRSTRCYHKLWRRSNTGTNVLLITGAQRALASRHYKVRIIGYFILDFKLVVVSFGFVFKWIIRFLAYGGDRRAAIAVCVNFWLDQLFVYARAPTNEGNYS